MTASTIQVDEQRHSNKEHCYQCHQDTETILAPLSSGHIGRLCAVCRTCRRGRPYASKAEYYQQSANADNGRRPRHEHKI